MTAFRQLWSDGPRQTLLALLSVAMVSFYVYTAAFAPLGPQYHRGIYVGISLVMIFLSYPSKLGTWVGKPIDVILIVAATGTVSYWMTQYEALNLRAGAENSTDFMVSCIGIVVALEASRRVLGFSFVLIALLMLGFAYAGPWMPEMIQHGGFEIEEIANYLFVSTGGVFGIMANVLATYVILFIFFGAFLEKSGGAKFFIDLPLALAGHKAGGPGKVSVIASGLFGSISGSAIANTVSTGSFTIPLMKKSGFKPEVAGAIEPAASIGGMFLPPIMGAGGFIMAELVERSYSDIMVIAILPALLYFLGVFFMIHFEAKRSGVTGLSPSELPDTRVVLKEGAWHGLPLLVIVISMILGRSAGYSAVLGIGACILVSWIIGKEPMKIPQILSAMIDGAKATLVIGATVGVIGVVVGVVDLTGIGLQISEMILSVAKGIELSQFIPGLVDIPATEINRYGQLLVTLILVAISSLVLGMGMPVTASYLVSAVLVVPAFTELGVSAIAAHMIVYWLSQDSNITPPVCVAAYAGAAIAKSDPWKTGWTAFRYAKMLYIMPILFAFHPEILLSGDWPNIALVYLGAIAGTVCFSSFVQGYLIEPLSPLGRSFMLGATALFFWGSILSIGIAVCLVFASKHHSAITSA
ncbi:TRAP transporter permease [Pseudobacteriovorax antillogorgiicola]|uniref:TRAP transporter, 4TM/12TM fusion protein n=1 Tax=Pseudobacteriovorax antillogorgiicola TaxID=1513793 RepID=A0A1Y6BHP7_9BACT|nr:TRAP transporter fused permease subunit [Pseudobacteriovorax antillogorgiicola]TCS57365.1 TRAP transporter 4TM/12TM fusion protein [Pseudobacteriovorax antillogorgiicola]SMF01960.1 TRAP transporter, 4TM/12TM fusion protein [Pseudobacteriovorax antillogorgiicola]